MKTIVDGLFRQNPVFKLALGLVPAVAVTTTAYNGLVLGVTTTIVLVIAVAVSAMLAERVPQTARPAINLAVLALLTMCAYQALLRLDPQVVANLGIFLPLIVVNGIALQTLDKKVELRQAVTDAFGSGLGFAAALVVVGIIRELLAFGTIFGATVVESRLPIFALAATVPGGMVILGLLLALYNAVTGQGGELSE